MLLNGTGGSQTMGGPEPLVVYAIVTPSLARAYSIRGSIGPSYRPRVPDGFLGGHASAPRRFEASPDVVLTNGTDIDAPSS